MHRNKGAAVGTQSVEDGRYARLAGSDDAADGVTAWKQDAAVIDVAGWSVWRVEVGAGIGNEGAAAGWAGSGGKRIGGLGVALGTEAGHEVQITRHSQD
jgi:hypothetical protein